MNTKWTEFIPIDNPDLWTLIDHKQNSIDTLTFLTKSVSENKSIEQIFDIYIQTLKSKYHYTNILVLYQTDNGWFVMHNNQFNHIEDMTLVNDLKQFDQITYVREEDTVFGEFDTIIPAKYEGKIIAYVLIEGVYNSVIDSLSEELRFLEAYTNVALLVAENKRLAKKHVQEKIQEKDIATAAEIQKSLIPTEIPESICCNFAAEYIPHNKIGGDSYDIITPPEEPARIISIADVSGKGVSAALLMANFQATLRALVQFEDDCIIFAKQLNDAIYKITKGDRFISLFLAAISETTNDIRYINFGHNPPYLKSNGKIKALTQGAPILGVFQKLPFVHVGRETWKEGDQLFCYTDGLVDARNMHDERFGEQRVEQFLENNQFESPNQLNSALLKEVYQFKGNQKFNDDVTLLTSFHRKQI